MSEYPSFEDLRRRATTERERETAEKNARQAAQRTIEANRNSLLRWFVEQAQRVGIRTQRVEHWGDIQFADGYPAREPGAASITYIVVPPGGTYGVDVLEKTGWRNQKTKRATKVVCTVEPEIFVLDEGYNRSLRRYSAIDSPRLREVFEAALIERLK